MNSNKFTSLAILVVIISLNIDEIIALHDKNDLRLTLHEKNALDKLKLQLAGEFKEDFIKTDFYLIRWLRRAKLDVQNTKKMVLQNIAWREENHIPTILNEDFSDIDQHLPIIFMGKDKEGRQVVEIDLGDGDLRATALQGKLKRLGRYVIYQTERALQIILKDQKQGKPVTRDVVLYDASGVNPVQHGCPMCISFLIQFISELDKFYPDIIDENIFINVPTIGRIVLNTVRDVALQNFNSGIKVFDTNRVKWMQYIDKRIDRDQRSPRYGGTAARP